MSRQNIPTHISVAPANVEHICYSMAISSELTGEIEEHIKEMKQKILQGLEDAITVEMTNDYGYPFVILSIDVVKKDET